METASSSETSNSNGHPTAVKANCSSNGSLIKSNRVRWHKAVPAGHTLEEDEPDVSQICWHLILRLSLSWDLFRQALRSCQLISNSKLMLIIDIPLSILWSPRDSPSVRVYHGRAPIDFRQDHELQSTQLFAVVVFIYQILETAISPLARGVTTFCFFRFSCFKVVIGFLLRKLHCVKICDGHSTPIFLLYFLMYRFFCVATR